ncbi:MAG: 5-formyltetrahydrofolate cyclo-ligase [Elusimicrobia bacterium CG1_02_37_114]|nr:MAG: 5-formyltetrahydrofolate cyclo-ligase [Elusimicrobia bacterium CG1_02_37_114]OIP01988.1 MAG: 5-formyltetrahydrofolate cyclo-ligase [Bacteroidetes bacterium CG2_30_33_31]
MNKKELRNHIKILGRNYTIEDLNVKSKQIFKNVEKELCFTESKVVMLFWSMADEVNTHEFIQKWHTQKTILLPVIQNDILEIKKFTGIENMFMESRFGIFQPAGDTYENLHEIDLIIVPGQAFDYQKNRIGRGKGYYDKLLERNNFTKAGICFDFQIVDKVPTENFDIKMDLVISEEVVIK